MAYFGSGYVLSNNCILFARQ